MTEDSDLDKLLPCPFCGAGETMFYENGRVWSGMKFNDPVSVSIRHWCESENGPSRMLERVGKDKAQAIEQWNKRFNNTLNASQRSAP